MCRRIEHNRLSLRLVARLGCNSTSHHPIYRRLWRRRQLHCHRLYLYTCTARIRAFRSSVRINESRCGRIVHPPHKTTPFASNFAISFSRLRRLPWKDYNFHFPLVLPPRTVALHLALMTCEFYPRYYTMCLSKYLFLTGCNKFTGLQYWMKYNYHRSPLILRFCFVLFCVGEMKMLVITKCRCFSFAQHALINMCTPFGRKQCVNNVLPKIYERFIKHFENNNIYD